MREAPERKVCVFIATSLDGYIARSNGDLDWLALVEDPPEDYGYSDFISTVDTVIMGRTTYEKVLGFGVPFPHTERTCYVLSSSRSGSDEHVEFFNGPVADLIQKIRSEKGASIFCDGGAETIFQLQEAGLVDRYIISIIPVLLGSGIPLFKPGFKEQNLSLSGVKNFRSGLVQLWYEKK